MRKNEFSAVSLSHAPTESSARLAAGDGGTNTRLRRVVTGEDTEATLPGPVNPWLLLSPPVRRAAVALGGPLLQVPVVEKRAQPGIRLPHTPAQYRLVLAALVLPRKDWHPCFQCCQPASPAAAAVSGSFGFGVVLKIHLTQSQETRTLLLQVTQEIT